MTVADKLNVIGILITGFGSTLAMVGIYKQTNGYFAFETSEFFVQMYRIFRRFVLKGRAEARNQIDIAAALGKARGEDRGKALIGFYCVLFGFFFQMLGSALMLLAPFVNGWLAVPGVAGKG